MDRRWGIAWLVVGLVAGWLARSPDAPVPEQVIRWTYAPGEVRTEVAVQRPARASVECLEQRVAALAWLGVKPAVELEEPATEPECRAQLDLAVAIATERQLEKEGMPQQFLADTLDEYREAAVAAVARKVVETCPELGLTLRRVDCSEYPCVAWFLGGGDAGYPGDCQAWKDAYGSLNATASDTLIGPDGQRLQLRGIGPVEPHRVEPKPTSAEEEERIASRRGEHSRRLLTRRRNERDGVVDELGAREETEAERREDQRANTLAFWQHQADEGDDSAAQMVETLKKQWAEEDAAAQE
jgi:hypothetical protein